jgi:hypothetical protein
MTIHKVNNLFSPDELEQLKDLVNQSRMSDDRKLGRIQSTLENIPDKIVYKMWKIVNDLSDRELHMTSATYTEYNLKHGQPNLPPHFDGDVTDFIVNFQLSANSAWDIGINKELYRLEDNSAIVFNPNTNIHWRPHVRFEEGDYVKMLFVRFISQTDPSDYSDKAYSLDHEVFKEIRDYRDSLKPSGI